MKKLKRRLTYANVVSTLALVLVIGGGAAYAAGKVFSRDIVNGQVKSPDIAKSAVKSKNIANGQVSSDDIGDFEVEGSDIADGAIGDGKVEADSLTSFELDGTTAQSTDTSCAGDDGELTVCASAEVSLDGTSDLLMIASGNYQAAAFDDPVGAGSSGDDASLVDGFCNLRLDATDADLQSRMRMVGSGNFDSPIESFSLIGLGSQVDAGSHTVDVICRETDGDIDWSAIKLAVVATG